MDRRMGPDMDHMRLSQHYSTPTRGTGTTNLDSLDGWHSYPSPTPGSSPVIRGLSVDELKQQTAQRITQTVFNQQSPRLDQRQQQQDYMVANEKGAGRQLRGQYSYPGTTNSPRISTSDASRRFQSAPGSLSTDPRRFQSAPGSIPDSSAQQHVQQRVGIPHGLTVHELKAMTRARLALCAVSSGPSQVKAHEKAATSSVSHSPTSMLSKETTPCSGSSHSYAPMPKQQQMHHFVKNFQVLEQQKQIREEACRLENRRVSENESAAHYLCTTSSNQSANGSSPASMKDRNIRMKPFPNQPHRMHQQVAPQRSSPSYGRATNSSVASRVSYLPDNANARMSLPIELDKTPNGVHNAFTVEDLPSSQACISPTLSSHHSVPNNYWGKDPQYNSPFASSSSKLSSPDATSPAWGPSARHRAYQSHEPIPSFPENMLMAQSVAEFALLTPNEPESIEEDQFRLPGMGPKLLDLTGDAASWATHIYSASQ